MAGTLRNALGHGEMIDAGYNSPIAGQEGHTVSGKLFLPSLLRAPVSGTLEAIMDTVRACGTYDACVYGRFAKVYISCASYIDVCVRARDIFGS